MARAGFPRAARLLRPQEFTAAKGCRQRLSTRNFVVEYWPAPGVIARVGLAVSRRVSKHAVQRNRIRRQIRESFRKNRGALPKIDVLLIARSQAANNDNACLRDDLDDIWRRLGATQH